MDQMIFVQQHGKNKHEDICASLEVFASQVQPAFKAKEVEREARKAEELAPYIEAALARKPRMEMPTDADLPVIKSAGLRLKEAGVVVEATPFTDRGGGIPVIKQDPAGNAG
jgi:hypothetical protein